MRETPASPAVAEAIRDTFVELLRRGMTVRCTAGGCSMRPWIRAGDALWVRRNATERFRPGDLAVFRGEEGRALTVHRVTRWNRAGGARGVWTRGDARARGGWIPAGCLEGRVVRIDRGTRTFDLERLRMRWRATARAAWSELRALGRLLSCLVVGGRP